MEDGRIPKDILYSELANGKRTTGRPHLRYKDVGKRDLKALDIDVNSWEELAEERSSWRQELTARLEAGERNLLQAADENHLKRKVERTRQPQILPSSAESAAKTANRLWACTATAEAARP